MAAVGRAGGHRRGLHVGAAHAERLAGAPERPAAGLTVHKRLGEQITIGEPLLTIHAEASGEIDYAMSYAHANAGLFTIEG